MGRAPPRTRRLSPRRKPAQPAPQNHIVGADNAALPAVPGGAASPHSLRLQHATSADAGGSGTVQRTIASASPPAVQHIEEAPERRWLATAALLSRQPFMAQGEANAGKVFDRKSNRSF
jgi:hypothetical protein